MMSFSADVIKSTSHARIQCQICSKLFENADSLSKHRFKHHAEAIHCSSCPEIFYSLAGLTRHENKVHNPLRQSYKEELHSD